MTTIIPPGKYGDPMYTLQAEAQHGVAAYAFQPRIARNGRGDMGEVVSALNAQSGETGKGDAAPCVAYAIQAGAIKSNPNIGPDGVGVRTDDCAYTIEARSEVQAVAFQERGREDGRTLEIGGEVAYALTAPSGGGRAQERNILMPTMQVRRLTPVECERLQGFPDNYTAIPWRKKPASECPDGPRYRALGNSMAVPVMRWVGARIAANTAAMAEIGASFT